MLCGFTQRKIGKNVVLYLAGDSGFKTNPDQTSQCGYVCLLVETDTSETATILACLDWKSAKIARVCCSTMAAEMLQTSACL